MKAINKPCYIVKVCIYGLWGESGRDIVISFYKDVNIIIGPNASGKTTILNIIHYVLTGDMIRLADIKFRKVVVELKEFESRTRKKIEVEVTKTGFSFSVAGINTEFDIDRLRVQDMQRRQHSYNRMLKFHNKDILGTLAEIAPIVWLPVSRRLPISEDDEDFIRMQHGELQLESVEVRLRDLLNELKDYRLRLEAQLADRYKQFEKQVLQSILFSKKDDRSSYLKIEAISQESKNQLIRAFQAAGLLDDQMLSRINEHFTEASQALDRLNNRDSKHIEIDDVFIIPLISRTKALSDSARELEEERESLFEPLTTYEKIANSFLTNKIIKVQDDGKLHIQSRINHQHHSLFNLSSGEKQILILLTQALLKENNPVIYIADEPELSLHISWQEQLLQSLADLGKQIQIIVATHSPDIVGPFQDKIINLTLEKTSL